MSKEAAESSQSSEERSAERQTMRFGQIFLIAVLIGLMVLFFSMVRGFLVPVLLASVFTTLFYPLYRRLLSLTRDRRRLSSLTCCAILLLGILVPVFAVADLVSGEAAGLYKSGESFVRRTVDQGDEGLLGQIKGSRWVQRLGLLETDWQQAAQDVATSVTGLLAKVMAKTSQGTFHMLVTLFVMFFTMFYFFLDGDALVRRIKYLSPLSDEQEDAIIVRFVSISRATVKGTLLIGVLQGTLGGITLWACGVPSAAVWGVVMIILSIIPMVGSWLILYPAAAIEILLGNVWQGIVIAAVALIIISNVDNLLRPRFVGRDSGMHDLLVFFSTLGGISMFGAMGFIVGPVLAVFFLSVLDIYGEEFKHHLEDGTAGASQEPTPAQEPGQIVEVGPEEDDPS